MIAKMKDTLGKSLHFHASALTVAQGVHLLPVSMAPQTERFEMRLETTMIERVDAWRRKQEDLPSRAEPSGGSLNWGFRQRKLALR